MPFFDTSKSAYVYNLSLYHIQRFCSRRLLIFLLDFVFFSKPIDIHVQLCYNDCAIAMIPDDPYILPQANLNTMAAFYRGFYPRFSMETFTVTLSKDERIALATALDQDNAMPDANDRYFSKDADDKVIGIIRAKRVVSHHMESTHPSEDLYETYYITEAWKNTLAFVREKGFDAHFESDYTVTDLRYQRYTPRYAPNGYGMAMSYVFFSCENAVQIRMLDSFNGRDVTGSVVRATTPVPADKWDACLEACRPVAFMTRPGVMVQIILTNAKGEEKLVTRYLYDEDLSLE